MNTYKLAGLFLLITISINSQLNAEQDEKARKILDELSEQTKSAQSVSIDFTIAMGNLKDDISEEFEGKLTMKGEKYKLLIMGMESWFDGTSIFTYMPDLNEVLISDPDEEGGLMSNPTQLFTIYHEEFNYKLTGTTNLSGKELYEIHLHPLDQKHDFHSVKLFIDRNNNFLHSAVIDSKDGNRYIFTVNEFDNTIKLSDSYFDFNESDYPEIEIIDMRW